MSVGRILLSVLQGERVTIQQMDIDVSVNEASNWTLRAGSVSVGLIPPGEIWGGGWGWGLGLKCQKIYIQYMQLSFKFSYLHFNCKYISTCTCIGNLKR